MSLSRRINGNRGLETAPTDDAATFAITSTVTARTDGDVRLMQRSQDEERKSLFPAGGSPDDVFEPLCNLAGERRWLVGSLT